MKISYVIPIQLINIHIKSVVHVVDECLKFILKYKKKNV